MWRKENIIMANQNVVVNMKFNADVSQAKKQMG
jgi:hypothetical protein